MKISVINRHAGPTWEIAQIQEAGKKAGIDVDVRDITSLNDFGQLARELGEVVIWRSGTVDKFVGKTTFMRALQGKVVINQTALAAHPYLPLKLYQQKMVEERTGLPTIPTYNFGSRAELAQALEAGRLRFPLVQKPILGARGMGVKRVEAADELPGSDEELKHLLYQPFISNRGDYRVLMVGGVMLGAIKRTAAKGGWLNNISQGGSAEVVTDPVILRRLRFMAGQIVSLFELGLTGIDIMEDAETGQLYFLELNTAVQWQGFQEVTGVPVAEKLVELGLSMVRRAQQPVAEQVREYYLHNAAFLPAEKQFHFFSRLWLSAKDTQAREQLEARRAAYLGATADELKGMVAGRLEEAADLQFDGMHYREQRRPVMARYPKLNGYNRVLFLLTFAQAIYGEDVREAVQEVVPREELLSYRKILTESPADVAVLSTHAVNYLYLTQNIFPDIPQRTTPDFFWQNVRPLYNLAKPSDRALLFYLCMHCIIGESHFYSRPVSQFRETYLGMIHLLDKLLATHYHDFSLDIKFEFLVAANLVGYQTPLESVILSEAGHSFSPMGNFLVDTLNGERGSLKKYFQVAEHSNVLFLMAEHSARAKS